MISIDTWVIGMIPRNDIAVPPTPSLSWGTSEDAGDFLASHRLVEDSYNLPYLSTASLCQAQLLGVKEM